MFRAGELANELVVEVGFWVLDSGEDRESIGEAAGGEGERIEEEFE